MATGSDVKELAALRIPLRDGVELVADAFVGDGAPPGPAIIELTPYGRGRDCINFSGEASYWVGHGYVPVTVDCRGTGDSGGRFAFFVGDAEDGFDVITWVSRQPWCDGRVALRGASYSGTNAWLVARLQPPALRALVANATAWGVDDVVYDGGIFHQTWALTWPSVLKGSPLPHPPAIDWPALRGHRPLRTLDQAALGRPSALFREFLDHPPSDAAYWRPFHFSAADYARIGVPVLAFSGWFDGTLRGTLAHDRGLRAAAAEPANVHLIVGPWDHVGCSDGGIDFRSARPLDRVGSATLPPQAFRSGLAITRAFLDAHLKGQGRFEQPPVQVYLTGSHRWLDAQRFPPPTVQQRPLFLRSAGRATGLQGDGRLAWQAPHDEPPDQCVHDPCRPVPGSLADLPGAAPGTVSAMADHAALIDRPDVLVYQSDPLPQALTVLGTVRLALHVRADVPDADFFCRLEDVAPDGRAQRLGSRDSGQLQARWREGFECEVMLQPGVPAQLLLNLDAIGHAFGPGHCLRLSIACSAWPRCAPNPGTGAPVADDVMRPRVAHLQVLHEAGAASCLLLPCLPEPPGD
ncbi:MAG: CocE/NonD family hydrolase [Proteobacteria bacterium]|nr:CocE/NonD family hydrolase [Pseudomonadota bacterium]